MKTPALCFVLFLGANAIDDIHDTARPNLIRRNLRKTIPEDILRHYYRGADTPARAARLRLLRHTAASEDSEDASSEDMETSWARSRDDAASEDGPEEMSTDVALIAY
jgi:hypothetical protein